MKSEEVPRSHSKTGNDQIPATVTDLKSASHANLSIARLLCTLVLCPCLGIVKMILKILAWITRPFKARLSWAVIRLFQENIRHLQKTFKENEMLLYYNREMKKIEDQLVRAGEVSPSLSFGSSVSTDTANRLTRSYRMTRHLKVLELGNHHVQRRLPISSHVGNQIGEAFSTRSLPIFLLATHNLVYDELPRSSMQVTTDWAQRSLAFMRDAKKIRDVRLNPSVSPKMSRMEQYIALTDCFNTYFKRSQEEESIFTTIAEEIINYVRSIEQLMPGPWDFGRSSESPSRS